MKFQPIPEYAGEERHRHRQASSLVFQHDNQKSLHPYLDCLLPPYFQSVDENLQGNSDSHFFEAVSPCLDLPMLRAQMRAQIELNA